MFKSTRELYEERIKEMREGFEARIRDLRERVIRAEQTADAKDFIIDDLIDKVLLKHGSSGRKSAPVSADTAPQEISVEPPIRAVLDADEEDEDRHFQRQRDQLESRAREVDPGTRNDLLQAAREVQPEEMR